MRKTLYEIHLICDGKYIKEYIRAQTTEELKIKLDEIKNKGEILSIESQG